MKLVLLGGFSFWLPDTIWHATRGINFTGKDVIAITALMPLSLLVAYLLLKRRATNEPNRNVGLPLLVGVWTLGGLFIAGGASFSGGGFVGPDGLRGGVIASLIGLLPPLICMLATYDGSLGALFLVTLAAAVVAVSGRLRKQQYQE